MVPFAIHCARFDPAKPDVVGEMQPITFKERDRALSPQCSGGLELQPSEAQNLMDELWNAGLRPSGEATGIGQLSATEKHLEDMRALVFHSAEAEKP